MWPWLRRGLALVLLGVLVFFFWPLIGEIRAAGALFKQADWIWLLVALGVQWVSYVCLTWLNVLALQPFSGPQSTISFWRLMALLAAMAFIQIAVPSAGASGTAMRVRILGKYGYLPEAALFSLVVESVAELVALFSVGLLGVGFLLSHNRRESYHLVWLGLACVTFLVLVWSSWRVLRDRRRGRHWAGRLVQVWNRTLGKFSRLHIRQWEARWEQFQTGLEHYQAIPGWKFLAAAYGKVFLDVATLGAGFWLVGYTVSLSALFTGYGLILTFSGMAALPGALGVTDAYTPVIFSWLGVPGSVALAAGLVYRLIAYWFLRLIGFFCWQWLEAQGKRSAEMEGE